MADDYLSFKETVAAMRDFLETAFHTVLYIRQVYPPVLFQQVRKYGCPVWQCRADPVCEYLGRVINCIEEELEKGSIRRVMLVVREATPEATPLERFVFDLEWYIKEQDMPKDGPDFVPATNGVARKHVDDLFRAGMVKLNMSTSYLKPIPSDTPLTFAVLLEMAKDAPMPMSKAAQAGDIPVEWIPAERRDAMEDDGSGPGRGHTAASQDSSISPIEGIRFGLLGLDMAVEEMAEKFLEPATTGSSSGGGAEFRTNAPRDRKGKGRA
ncbi:DNA-binding protein [Rhodotorula sp. JG-1b]|nr:DNA-binding protein [Rhodotorula sp. JG-1b]